MFPMMVVKVTKWVTFYKTYRDILISDLVHIRRPDMQARAPCMHYHVLTCV